MRIVVVCESGYGNTHLIADAIGDGLAVGNEVEVVPVAKASQELAVSTAAVLAHLDFADQGG